MLESYKDTITILKDLASIVTPFVLAGVGLAINASLQRQGKISDRNAHIAKSWADDFAKTTKSVNDISTEILFSYWSAKMRIFYPMRQEEAFLSIKSMPTFMIGRYV